MSYKNRRVHGHVTRLGLHLRLGLLVVIGYLALACASAAAPATPTPLGSTGTPFVEPAQTPLQTAGDASTTSPTATSAPMPTPQETVATPTTTGAPVLETPSPVPQNTEPGGDDQAVSVPDKGSQKYPNLGSRLDLLVANVEGGKATAAEAVADTSVHSGEFVAVTIYLSGNVDDLVSFLKDNGGDPRNVGEDYVEAYVPVALLGPLSERPGVTRVREIVPPEPEGSG